MSLSADTREIIFDKMSFSKDITMAANSAVASLMPEKSKKIYEHQYLEFMKWCAIKNVSEYSEVVLLAYFYEISDKFKSSTLWSVYSMLKSTLAIRNNIDISKFFKLTAFLKNKSKGYRAKKSSIFTRNQLEQFFREASDELYLFEKVNF